MSDQKPKFKVHHDHKNCDGHNHSTKELSYSRAFIIGIILNFGFTIIEFIYGTISNSLALIADAGHNLSDVLGLVIAFIATFLIKRKASQKFTFGLRGSTIISALLNSILLFIAVGAILWEAIHRLNSHSEIQTNTMIIVAGIGIVINFTTAMFFHSHSHTDLNARGAFLHLIGDAAISLGVVLAGLAIKLTGIEMIDPIISIIISLIIIISTWRLFKESISLTINAVPEAINLDEIVIYLKSIKGVTDIYDLHVWGISTTENALSAHLIVPKEFQTENLLVEIEFKLKEKFNIIHSTIQIEAKIRNSHPNETCFQVSKK